MSLCLCSLCHLIMQSGGSWVVRVRDESFESIGIVNHVVIALNI